MKLYILSLPTLSGGGVALDKELGGDAGLAIREFENNMLQDARTGSLWERK